MSYPRESLRELRKLLASLYPRARDQERMAAEASLDVGMIAWGSSAYNTWHEILHYANVNQRIDVLLKHALEEFPHSDGLLAFAQGRPIANTDGAMVDWRGKGNERQLLEKVVGESSLVDVSRLALGVQRARSVAKVVNAQGAGTGFLIAPNRLLTNHHVLPDPESAAQSRAIFNYERTVDGKEAQTDEFALSPDEYFQTSPDDDWTVTAVKGEPGQRWGHIELTRTSIKRGDVVNIIQHPGGAPKQVSLSFDVVAYVGEGRVQYLTDTLPGSSGSPVFDEWWNVVALHHSGGWLEEPGSTTGRTFYRNQGIEITRILNQLGG